MYTEQIDDEIKEWKYLFRDSETILLWVNIVVHAILVIVYTFSLLIVIFKYKRREAFLLAIPILFLAEVIFGGIYWVLYLHETDPCDTTGSCDPLPRAIFTITVFTSYYPHILFASQYFKTSMTLPKILTQAKVEVKQQGMEPNQNLLDSYVAGDVVIKD